MRRIVSVLLFLVGAAALVVGVGKVSFWSPAPTLTASVPQGLADAPVTLLTQELRDATAGTATVTVHGTGEFVAALGSETDVNAWVADAAANEVTGVDRTSHSFSVNHRNGAATTPDPRGSDLWVSEEHHTGDWEAAWKVPSQGKWTLLLATDGTKPAPVDISMTWDNPAAQTGAKWGAAMPWIIGGVLALALGAAWLMTPRRKRRRRRGAAVAASPRRAARLAAETGQLPVVTPAVSGRRAAAPAPAHDDAAAASSSTATSAGAVPATAAGLGAAAAASGEQNAADPSTEETLIHPRLVAEDPAAAPQPDGGAWDAQPTADVEDAVPAAPGAAPAPEGEAALPAGPNAVGQDEGSLEEGSAGTDAGTDSDDDADNDHHDDHDGGAASEAATGQLPTVSERGHQDDARREDDSRREGGAQRRGLRIGATILATIGLTLPAGPALADETPSGTGASTSQSTQAPSGSTGSTGASEGTDGTGESDLPVILQMQLDRILTSVADEAKAADAAKDAGALSERFSGAALEIRKDYYAALAKGVKFDAPPVPTLVASPIKAAAVTTTSAWPRTVMVLTQAQPSESPVVITLEQLDARSNYKAVSAVPMVPGVTFPGVALGSSGVKTQTADAQGFVAKPSEVLTGFGEWVEDAKGTWGQKFETSAFVDALRTTLEANRKANESAEQNAKNRTSFSVDESSTRVLTSPQGGSLVSGYITMTNTVAPEDKGTNDVPEVVQKLAGVKDKTTKKNIVTTYRIPVTFYVPASGSGEKIRLVAASIFLYDAALK